MPVYYLETSVLVKRYRTEVGSDVAVELVDRPQSDDSFVTSYLSALEVEATAARALKAKIINARGYGRMLGQFAQELGEIVMPQPISDYVVFQAIDFARRYSLRTLDAVHLATASLIRTSLELSERMVFVTSDGELAEAAQADGLEILDLRQPASAFGALARIRQGR